MAALPTQAIIDTFLERRSPCAVCGTVAWDVGDLLRAPVVSEPIRAFSGPQLLMQSFRCTGCDNLVLIYAARTVDATKADD